MHAGAWISKTAHIGCQWGYSSLWWQPDSPIFDKARASGLSDVNWQNAILVKQNGRRFHDEMDGGHDFFAAALSYSGDPNKKNGGGPIWAIFDADAVARQEWDPTPPNSGHILHGLFIVLALMYSDLLLGGGIDRCKVHFSLGKGTRIIWINCDARCAHSE